jgi:methylated-DNA-[protein]-cysteine S-methyltransferase
MTEHYFAIFDTEIGRCGIAWGPRGINAVQLPMSSEDKTRARIRQRYGDIAEAPPPAEVQRAIDGIVELLAGKPNDLADVVLDLEDVPEFNRGVYDIARTIPPGQTLTYGDIAKRLGGVELSRDVGQAASPPSSRCWQSRARSSTTRRICSIELFQGGRACSTLPLPWERSARSRVRGYDLS